MREVEQEYAQSPHREAIERMAQGLVAVDAALQMGSSDPAAVRYLMMTGRDESAGNGTAPIRLEASDLGALIQYERPLPSVQEYDRLLGWEVIQ